MVHSKHRLDPRYATTTTAMEVEESSSSSDRNHTILYAVQKCSHPSGGDDARDMLRLFHGQREAEEAAYHSAKHLGGTDSVKTLMLPSVPAALNSRGSSYGFLVHGTLFWVRALRATIVTANSGDRFCHSAAYAILTGGVIGGTSGKRGTEVCDGRVFGGDAAARAIAEQAVQRVAASYPMGRVEARMVAVGKTTADWFSTKAFLRDWPEQTTSPTTTTITMKRPIDLGRTVSQSMSDDCDDRFVVVDCPFEQQPFAKRRRLVSVTDDTVSVPASAVTSEDDYDSSSHQDCDYADVVMQ